jgi:hypothetical protein
MNETEQEAIILNATWEMIDNMVNWAMIVKYDEPLRNVMFETSQHARLFNILLGDFLSDLKAFKQKPPPFGLRPAPPNARASDLTFLYYLRQICGDPRLGSDVGALREAVEVFATWLEHEFVAEGVNLSSIDVVADIKIQRWRYIKICGDIGKHNIVRLETNASHIRKLVTASGHPISEQDSYLAINDFYEWFHTNIFIAHSSAIADFLNNIRLAIYRYAREEFARAYVRTDAPFEGMYHFDVPSAISEPVARAMYWDLMNRMRRVPFMRPFDISDFLKSIY